MRRRTYTFSAAALMTIASLSFSGADGAEAFAQDNGDDPSVVALDEAADQSADSGADGFEIMPLEAQGDNADALSDGGDSEVNFVSQPVIQSIPETPKAPEAPDGAQNLRQLVNLVSPEQLSEQMRCLAGAVYFEARGEPLDGQLAVARVVINRSEDRRFPGSYCGVVYQRAQFSFVKNGRMPRIRTGSTAWERAKAIAQIAHDDMWDSQAGDAVYFHANYVRPSWSRRKTRTAQIDTHIFYR